VRLNGEFASAEGVCLAEFVDFDADGTDELLVVYYDKAVEEDKQATSSTNDATCICQ
jgi:hypothetical protein